MNAGMGRKLRTAMTVADLKAELEFYDDDAVVVFQSDYGDYTHTQQALPIREVREIGDDEEVYENDGYSRSGLAIRELDEGRYEDDEDRSGSATATRGPKFIILQ